MFAFFSLEGHGISNANFHLLPLLPLLYSRLLLSLSLTPSLAQPHTVLLSLHFLISLLPFVISSTLHILFLNPSLSYSSSTSLFCCLYSTIGSDVRSTRLGYKNQQKVKAFELMAHLADNLAIHPSVIVRAKEE